MFTSALLQHTTRTFHNLQGQVESRDSGLWINSFDYTGIQHITPHVPEINDSFRTHCREDRPFCGYPWFLPVKFLSKSVDALDSARPFRPLSGLLHLFVVSGRTGTCPLPRCLPALQWNSSSCLKRRPAGGPSK